MLNTISYLSRYTTVSSLGALAQGLRPSRPNRAFTPLLLLAVLCLSLTLVSCTKDKKDSSGDGGDETPGEACSLIGLKPKIINGTACREGNAAIVSIAIRGPEGASLCTGTMVKKDTVLTAGHCFQDITEEVAEQYTVEVTGGPIGSGSQRATASNFEIHPDYDLSVDQTLKNDVAYLTLEAPLNLPTLPIIVSNQVQLDDELAIYGYGKDEDSRTGVPKSGKMTVIEITQDNIFADFVDNSSNTCTGDSGGPAVVRTKTSGGKTVIGLVGVTSTGSATGQQSCSKGERSSFTNLVNPEVLNWIKSNIPGVIIE